MSEIFDHKLSWDASVDSEVLSAHDGWPNDIIRPQDWHIEDGVFVEASFVSDDFSNSLATVEDVGSYDSAYQDLVHDGFELQVSPVIHKERSSEYDLLRKLGVLFTAGVLVSPFAASHFRRAYKGSQRREEDEYYPVDVVPNGADVIPTTESASTASTTEEALSLAGEAVAIEIVDDILPMYELTQAEVDAIWSSPAEIVPLDQAQDYFRTHFRHQDRNTDPTYRASTLQLLTPSGEGSASLVRFEDQLYIRTIRHVMDVKDYTGEAPVSFNVYIPGVGYAELPEYLLSFHEDGGDYDQNQDTNILIPVRLALAKQLEVAISTGVISPLHIASIAPEYRAQIPDYMYIPNPETGGYIRLVLDKPAIPNDETDNTHVFTVDGYNFTSLDEAQAAANLICAGFSGSPVVSGENPSEVYGSVSAVSWGYNPEYQDARGRVCSITVYVQEN